MTIGTSSSIYYDPFSAEVDRNVQAVSRLMREEQPVYWTERYGFWALSRFEDVWGQPEFAARRRPSPAGAGGAAVGLGDSTSSSTFG
jgi:hypothetical protein